MRLTSAAPLWELQARHWSRIAPPLRPSDEDLRVAQDVVDDWFAIHSRPALALVLGSTVELAALRWPAGSTVVAVDNSLEMIRSVWQTGLGPRRGSRAIAADWLRLPVHDGCCDIVFGDGCLAPLRGEQAPAFSRAIRRVLRADGVALLRNFVLPPAAERPEAVWADAMAGSIASFSAFKLRLLMALQGDNGHVRVHDAWRFVAAAAPSLAQLSRAAGWPIDEIAAIDAYRDQDAVYWFPTFKETCRALQGEFDVAHCWRPSYELGERCPTMLLVPRSPAS